MRTLFVLCFSVLCCSADWLTYGHDPQRSGSSNETAISPENVKDLALLWETRVDNAAVALSALTAPVVAEDVATANGVKSLVFVAGSSNTFFAVDAASGAVVWNRTFTSYATPKQEAFYLCPNTPNATPVIDKQRGLVFTIASDGRLYGLDMATGSVKFGPFVFVPIFAKPWSLNLNDGVIYTTTSQGCGGDRSGIYSMRISNPAVLESHELLVRQGSGAGMWLRGGTVVGPDGSIYVSTGDGALEPAHGDYGNVFLSAPADLSRVQDYYAPANWATLRKKDLDLPSGGLLGFTVGGVPMLAGAGKESVLYLLDAKSLGGANHGEPVFASQVLANEGSALEEKGIWGAPAVWTDSSETSWLYFPIWGATAQNGPAYPVNNGGTPHGSVVAFKVIAGGPGKPRLEPAWISPDINLPDAPIIANGVVYIVATGENPRQDHMLGVTNFKSTEEWKKNLLTTEERGEGTHPAVLMALDARSGKALYQSGDAMKSWVHFSGLALSGGRIFAVDHDSRLYCFGLPSIKK